MFTKKFVSFVSIVSLFILLFPTQVFAQQLGGELIKSVTLTVNPNTSSPQTFDATAGQILQTAVVFDTQGFPKLTNNSAGYVKVFKDTKVVKTLVTWGPGAAVPATVPNWDGKAIDATADAQSVCVTTGAVCPAGDYVMEAEAEFQNTDGDTVLKKFPATFKMVVTPSVAISNFTQSANNFNPIVQTDDISFTTSATGFITVEIFDGSTLKRTLVNAENLSAGTYNKTNKSALAWNGRDDQNLIVPNKTYQIKISSRLVSNGPTVDVKTADVTVNAPTSTIIVTSLNTTTTPVSSDGNFDPAVKGNNQKLNLSYALNQAADSIRLDIQEPTFNKIIRTLSPVNLTSGTETWDGLNANGEIVPPGTYTLILTANKSGFSPATLTKTFNVVYTNSNRGTIQNFTATPDSFDPNVEDAVIEFTNSEDSNITVEVKNPVDGALIKTFSDYSHTSYVKGTNHSISWNGHDANDNSVSLGTYKLLVTMRNDYGVVVQEKVLTINNSGGTVSTSNAHIENIYFTPSSKFEPAKNDQLTIRYNVLKNLDLLQIYAVRGTDKVELLNESTVQKESSREVTWDGRDSDGDYAAKGTWRIKFISKVGNTQLIAIRNIDVDYRKPVISDLYISKSRFDNTKGEFTYVMFRVDSAAKIQLTALQNNSEVEKITEDMDVEANQWYAVPWDGSNYDSTDSLAIRLDAQNTANKNVLSSQKVYVYINKDDDFGNVPNITNDYISPVLTDGKSSMTLYYRMSQNADVNVTIYRGTNASGSTIDVLADIKNQKSGDHTINWNGLDSSGNQLGVGVYTYKISSSGNGSDNETGEFIVGNVGSVEGGSASYGGSNTSNSSSSNTSGKISPNVKVDGGTTSNTGSQTQTKQNCAGFSDVLSTNKFCDAIKWAKDAGVFVGYANGTFGPSKTINRVEMLKTILESFQVTLETYSGGTLGFVDVESNAWYMPYIQTGKSLGIFQGDGGKKTARPADAINRAEASKILMESLRITGKMFAGKSTVTCSGDSGYNDIVSGAWYYNYACNVGSLGLLEAVEGNFSASQGVTRAEFAGMLYRLHDANIL